jgi:hypothetical protein
VSFRSPPNSSSKIDSLKAENETQLESAIISKGENTCKQSDSQNELCKQLTIKDKQYQELLKSMIQFNN